MSQELQNRTTHIETWRNIKRHFELIFQHSESDYLFRGQADASWGLEPSLLRRFKQTGKTFKPENIHGAENEARTEFLVQAHLHISEYIIERTRDEWDLWGLMQQYGAPTRMLDWTLSPYIAAYFAANQHFKCDGAIWYINFDDLQEMMEPVKDPNPSVRPHVYITPTDRVIAQQSVATFSNDLTADHATVLDDLITKNNNRHIFHKITFPANQKVTILKELRQMNITAASLFPGIDGLGRSIAELYDMKIRH